MSAFPQLNQDILSNVHKLDELEEEFLAYQAMSGNDQAQHVWEFVKVNENLDEGKMYYQMGIIWTNLCSNLPILANAVLQVLTLPHSNAAEEWVFSMINKNKTQFQSILDLGKSLNSIMLTKMNSLEGLVACHKINFLKSYFESRNLHACITTKNIPVRLDFHKWALLLTANFLYFVYISL